MQVDEGVEHREAEPRLQLTVGVESWTPGDKPNEDRFRVNPDGSGVVADGVGSQENSAPAAKLTRNMMGRALTASGGDPHHFELAMNQMVEDIHVAVQKDAAEKGHTQAAVMSLIKPVTVGAESYVFVGSVGDAPAYLQRDGVMAELTDMHTSLPIKSADRPALGKPDQPALKAGWYKAQAGDVFVISSNGLRKADPDMSAMSRILREHDGDPRQTARKLVREAPERSGDSRTAIVLSYVMREKKEEAPGPHHKKHKRAKKAT